MNSVYSGTYKSALETNVSVHDGASSQQVNATELSVISEGKGPMNEARKALGSPRWSFDPAWGL